MLLYRETLRQASATFERRRRRRCHNDDHEDDWKKRFAIVDHDYDDDAVRSFGGKRRRRRNQGNDDDDNDCGVYVHLKRKTVEVKSPPTARDLIDEHAWFFDAFGEPNEIEYSANFVFEETPRLPTVDDRRVIVNRRRYFNSAFEIYADEREGGRVSNAFFEGHTRVLPVEAIARIDLDENTVKLKAVKRRYNYRDCTFALSLSYEVATDRFEVLDEDRAVGNKTLDFVYWAESYVVGGREYVLRVAFRTRDNRTATECNVECEDRHVDGRTFAVLFGLVFARYKWQYEHDDDRRVDPFAEASPEYEATLDARQLEIAATRKVLEWRDLPRSEPIDDPTVEQFVLLLGMMSYSRYIARPDVNFYCSMPFDLLDLSLADADHGNEAVDDNVTDANANADDDDDDDDDDDESFNTTTKSKKQ